MQQMLCCSIYIRPGKLKKIISYINADGRHLKEPLSALRFCILLSMVFTYITMANYNIRAKGND